MSFRQQGGRKMKDKVGIRWRTKEDKEEEMKAAANTGTGL